MEQPVAFIAQRESGLSLHASQICIWSKAISLHLVWMF